MEHEETNLATMAEVREALTRAQKELPSFQSKIAGEDAFLFLGNTRSGKSTLVNYLIDTDLVAFEERKSVFKIKKADENDTGPKIGQGTQSCTALPGVYWIDEYEGVVIDAPGFDDNRSEAQDIINALYINQVKHARTVRFVLVSDFNDLKGDNVSGFTDLITKVGLLLPQFGLVKTSVSMVFTKEDCKCSQYNVAAMLRYKILNLHGLLINTELVRYFVDNPESIGIFRMPAEPGDVTDSIVGIEEAMLASRAVSLDEKQINVAVSPTSRLVLLQIYQQHLDSRFFEEQVRKLIRNFSEYFDIPDYVFASLDDELTDLKQNLNRISTLFNTEIIENISGLRDIKQSLIRIFNGNISADFANDLNLLVLIDDALLMGIETRDNFLSKYKQALEQIEEKVQKLLSKIEEEMNEREVTRTVLKASAGTTAAAGGMGALGAVVNRACAEGSSTGSAFGFLGILGGVISAVGAGIAGATYIVEKDRQKKRIAAREKQGRFVDDGMFDDEFL